MLLNALAIVVLLVSLMVIVVVVEWFQRPTYRASAHIEIDDEGKREGRPGPPSN